jgi:hypothetical protein
MVGNHANHVAIRKRTVFGAHFSGPKIRLGLQTLGTCKRKPMQWTYGARRMGVTGENKSGHILVRTHVHKKAQISKNSGGMSGVLELSY